MVGTQRANLSSPPSPRAETAGSAKTGRPARPAHDQDQKSPAGPDDAPVGPKQERWTMTVRRCRYLRRACHSQSADLSSGNENRAVDASRDRPIAPAPKLISLAGRSRRDAHCNPPKNSSARSQSVGGQVPPAVFVPSAEENPCPCTAAQHNPDDDHFWAAHSPAHDLPFLET